MNPIEPTISTRTRIKRSMIRTGAWTAVVSALCVFGTSASASVYFENFDDETNGDSTPGSFTTDSATNASGGHNIIGSATQVTGDGSGKDYEFYSEAQVYNGGTYARHSQAALVDLPSLATSDFTVSTDFEVDANELGSGATNPGHGSHAGVFARNTSGAVPTDSNAYSLRLAVPTAPAPSRPSMTREARPIR